MGIFDSLLQAYVAPEKRAQQQAAYEAAAPQRAADNWATMMGPREQPSQSGPQMNSIAQLGIQMPKPMNIETNQTPAAKLNRKQEQQVAAPTTPIDKWKDQIDKMMRSGNPAFQKQAMDMMGTYFSKSTEAPPQAKVSAYGQQAIDMGLKPGTKAFRDMVEKLATTARTTFLKSDNKSGYMTREEKIQGGLDPDSTFVWNSSGMPTPVKSSSYTGEQLQSAAYAERMSNAEDTFTKFEELNFDPTTTRQKVGESIPYVGNRLQTADQQEYSRAKRDWVMAKLRDESGATINPSEFENDLITFFPQPGDLGPVIEAKKQARRIVEMGMAAASGGKYKPKDRSGKKAEMPPLPEGFTLAEDEDNG